MSKPRPDVFVAALLLGVLVGILLNFVFSLLLILVRGSQAPMLSSDFAWAVALMLVGLGCGLADYWRTWRSDRDGE